MRVERLIVQGYIEGEINATRVEIKAAGHVNGEINASELVIESKGIFEGSSIVKELQKPKNSLPQEIAKS